MLFKSNETNKAQVKMVKDAAEGLIKLPASNYELSELLKTVLLVKDHEADELILMTKAKILFLKLIKQSAQEDGWAYLSNIKGKMKSRKYIKELSRSQATRGEDPFRSISVEMVQLGAISRINTQVMLRSAYKEILSELELKLDSIS